MGVGVQPYAPAVSTPEKDSVPILQEAGWALGTVWSGGKSRPHRDSIPDHPAHSQSLYRLGYPWAKSSRRKSCNNSFVRRALCVLSLSFWWTTKAVYVQAPYFLMSLITSIHNHTTNFFVNFTVNFHSRNLYWKRGRDCYRSLWVRTPVSSRQRTINSVHLIPERREKHAVFIMQHTVVCNSLTQANLQYQDEK